MLSSGQNFLLSISQDSAFDAGDGWFLDCSMGGNRLLPLKTFPVGHKEAGPGSSPAVCGGTEQASFSLDYEDTCCAAAGHCSPHPQAPLDSASPLGNGRFALMELVHLCD